MSDGPDATPQPAAHRIVLDAVERRVLGVLVEKALSTPEYYPLTLKAVIAACNQRNNRDPIMTVDEAAVREALSSLQSQRLVMAVKADTGWATRWRQELDRVPGLQVREQAVLAELLLRGPQTEGELRARASRMRPLKDLEEVHESLARLNEFTPPLVVRLSAEGAVRGVRHAHTLYPDAEMKLVVADAVTHGEAAPARAESVTSALPAGESLRERVVALERRVARLEEFLDRELGASFRSEAPEGGE